MNVRKRFYKQAGVQEEEGAFAVLLDGRKIKTPAGAPFLAPTLALAESAAREWAEQGDVINPASMEMTQLVNTAIDRVRTRREDEIADLLRYVDTDLLLYLAVAPESLVLAQKNAWTPILEWARERFNAPFRQTAGLMPVDQDPACRAGLALWLEGLDDFSLAALHLASVSMGSLLLGAALHQGRIGPDDAHSRSEIDEAHQAAQWGDDEEAVARRARLLKDVRAAHGFLTLLRGDFDER